MPDFLQTVRERVVVYDGAMGTNIHAHNPTVDDYWGKEGCSEAATWLKPIPSVLPVSYWVSTG